MTTFLGLAALFWFVVFAGLAGAVVYLKRRGVFRKAADAATEAVKQDVQDAADKLTKG